MDGEMTEGTHLLVEDETIGDEDLSQIKKGLGELTTERKDKKMLKIGIKTLVRFALVVLLVANVAGQSEYTQIYLKILDFKNYYFLCWVSYSFLTVSFPIYAIYYGLKHLFLRVCLKIEFENPFRKLTYKRIMQFVVASFMFSPFQLFSAYTWYVSLDKIPVSVNGAIGQSEHIFIFILAFVFCLKSELKYIWVKGIIIVIASVGVVLLAVFSSTDSSQFPNPGFGVVMDVSNTFLSAIYAVMFTKFFGDVNVAELFLIQSIIGLIDFTIWWFVILILHYSHIERFNLTLDMIGFLSVESVLALTYELLVTFGLTLTKSPIYIALSKLLSIPTCFFIDLIRGITISWLSIISIVVIIISVILLNVVPFLPEKKDFIYNFFQKRVFGKLKRNQRKRKNQKKRKAKEELQSKL